jgi:HAMP domain-containing protein
MSVRVKKVETWKGKHRDITGSRVSTEDRSEEEVVIELKALCNVIIFVLQNMNITNPQVEELLNKLYEELKETLEFLVLKMDNDIREKYKERMEEEAKTREYNLLGDIHAKGLVALAKAVVEVIQLLQERGLEEPADSLEELARELIKLEFALWLEKLKNTLQKVLNKMRNGEAKKRGQLEQLKKNITELENRVAELEKQREELLNRLQEVKEIGKELKEIWKQLLKIMSRDTSRNTNYVWLETENTKMQSNCISHYSINMRGGYYSPVNTFEKVSRSNESLVPGGNLNNGKVSSNALKQSVGSGVGIWLKGILTVEVVREDNEEGVQGVEVEINGEVSRTDQRGVVVKEVDYGSKVRVVVRDTRVGDVVYVVERWEVEGGRAVFEENACTLEVSGNVKLKAYVKIVRVAE